MVRAWSVARVAALLLLATVCAALSNATAPTHRKLAWAGSYPRALEVGPAAPTPAAAAAPDAAPPAVAEMRPAPESPASTDASVPPAGATPGPAPAAPTPSTATGAVSPAELAKSFPPHPDKASVEIRPRDVELLYRGRMLFLDARRSSVYAEGHIAGARSFPVWESDIDARVKALYEEGLDQSAPVVAYCSGGNCEDSHMLAEKLYMVGFDNVLIYKDGFPDWQKRGLPVSKGDRP